MKTFLGIDFGTTQTSVSMIRAGSTYEPEIVEIDGKKTVDTALRLDAEDNVLLFGHSALERIHEAPADTFCNFKPAIGSGDIFRSSCKEYSPENLALIFLRHLCQKIGKKYFNVADLSKVADLYCTIGCPASWNEKQRQDLAELAEKAGFPNVSCCDEPFGVIYYYHFRGDLHLEKKTRNILVYDFGGGTTDVAIEEVTPSPDGSILGGPRLLAATGIPDLGGKNFDEKLRDHFIKDMGETAAALGAKDSRILEYYAKQLKETLSRSIEDGVNSAEKVIPMLSSKRTSHKLALSKNEFERVCGSFIGRMEEPVHDALNAARFEAPRVNNVILAGGSSRLYYVESKIKDLFPESNILVSANPVEVIAKGLALYGRSLYAATHTWRKTTQPDDERSAAQESPFHDKTAEPGHKNDSRNKKNKKWLSVAALIAIVFLGAVYWFSSRENLSEVETIPSDSAVEAEAGQSEQQVILSEQQPAADAGTQYELGVKYYASQDYDQAAELFRKAADQGHSAAQNYLGGMYLEGLGVAQNDGLAAEWVRKAANQGYAPAQGNLGWMYQQGRGVTQDDRLAVEWLRRAAEQGEADAQNHLGWMYQQGRGVTRDYGEAVQWYRRAAEQGFDDAQNHLGWMYQQGHGVTRDYEEAIQWYHRAAEQGHTAAQYNLGYMYNTGRGVTQDREEAYVYFYLALLNGLTESKKELDALEGIGILNFRKLSEEQIESAKIKARGLNN